MDQNNSVEQHSIGLSLFLHLMPGLLIGGAYYALHPILHQWGYPSLMALMCAILVVLVPLELGYLLYQARKKNGSFSLRGVVLYRVSIPTVQYFLWVPLVFVLIAAIFTLLKPFDALLQHQIFAWVPVLESGLKEGYSQGALIATYVMLAIIGSVVGPTVEELYFRGFLLPRMGYAGKWAPILHSFLFGVYHFWTPWMFLTRTVGLLPLIYAVRQRNLNMGIIVHVLVNLVDVVAGVSFIIAMNGHA